MSEKENITVATNKKAYHDYFVLDKYEAGIELFGTEIKSIRAGRVNLKDSFCSVDDGEMYVLMVGGQPVAEAVVLQRGEVCELCNLATDPDHRGKGYAGRLIRHLFKLYRPRCRRMEVGTSPTMISFYGQFGFQPAYIREGFFTDNYPEPIEEDGEILTDMHVLSVEL